MNGFSLDNRPKFSDPPVIEVMATAQFSELDQSLFITHIDDIWQRFNKEEYTTIEFKNSLPSLTAGNARVQFTMSEGDKFTHYPRIWLESEDHQFVVQLQADRLSFSWRMIDVHASSTYSHYELIWEKFAKLLSALTGFADDICGTQLELTWVELKYINLIPYNDFGGASNIQACIPSITLLNTPEYLGQPASVNFAWDFPLSSCDANFRIQGVTVQDKVSGDSMLRLDLIQNGKCDLVFDKDSKKIHNWFDGAHLRIVNAFKDITTEKMHNDNWKLI